MPKTSRDSGESHWYSGKLFKMAGPEKQKTWPRKVDSLTRGN